MSQSPLGTAYKTNIPPRWGFSDFWAIIFYQYLVPLGPRNPNIILRPITGYYFLDSPERGENQKVPSQLHKSGLCLKNSTASWSRWNQLRKILFSGTRQILSFRASAAPGGDAEIAFRLRRKELQQSTRCRGRWLSRRARQAPD